MNAYEGKAAIVYLQVKLCVVQLYLLRWPRHFRLLDALRGTPYRLIFVAHLLTDRFATVLRRFYCPSFIPSSEAVYQTCCALCDTSAKFGTNVH